MKLYYFPTPGRAETSRLMFVLAGTAFEDKHITGAEWAAFKAESPFGQLPFLELDCGKKIAQQIAIENYVAKLTGHEPEDAVVRAKGDEIRGLIEECWGLIIPTLSIADLDARIAARKELMAGALKKKLEFINTCVAAAPGNFLGGDKVSLADLSVFTVSSTLTSGILDGIPTDFLPGFPEIKALRNKVASLAGVKSYYANNEKRASFRPDA